MHNSYMTDIYNVIELLISYMEFSTAMATEMPLQRSSVMYTHSKLQFRVTVSKV